ncbi:hypothetical protein TNCV_1282401 [Trichonephila clavipes]|uniref:Mos1 transposase HTH domain-containing protein n=1 Tax=Trichonephila clavipes TaxID=2585209 RepID=A0A8X6VEK8_TRICX|nr:hypothetical protein TNCV_1282401 [Trichonephila clavipes]
MSAADIYRQITEVYGIKAMTDSKVQKWARKFKDERTNVHDEERSGQPSVVTDDLMQAVEVEIPQDYGNSALGPAWCFAGRLYATKNHDQLRCLLRKSAEAPKSIAKQTAQQKGQKGFAPPR